MPATRPEYEATIRERYGDLADAFLRALSERRTYKESILATTRDALYGWTAERLVRKQAALGMPAYLYLWDHGYPAADEAGLHAFHASELPYVFGTFDGTPPLWPKNPGHADRERALRRDGRLLDELRAHRPSARREAPAWPAYARDRQLHAHRQRRRRPATS